MTDKTCSNKLVNITVDFNSNMRNKYHFKLSDKWWIEYQLKGKWVKLTIHFYQCCVTSITIIFKHKASVIL